MARFYQVVIHPADGECPLYFKDEDPDCNSCEHCTRIDTLGGEFYIDCDVNER